jgi:hypothetical protein
MTALFTGVTYWDKKDRNKKEKAWLVWPVGYIAYALADGIHTALKQPKWTNAASDLLIDTGRSTEKEGRQRNRNQDGKKSGNQK